ncbi:DciA family protein [Vibrio sp. Of7-15]|uniref:DUF721 domain-containing protein n=1 Tax=Vibrio sp. Of7-15 TaxID=2724879 RepID=UPI001EF3A2DF|nr:DciA family protein [Vibrio sp. Of7-15]MCG7498173.1 DciA family protein [Vibrio sp. Of7-15]
MRDHRPTLTEDLLADSRFKELQEKAASLAKLNKILSDVLSGDSSRHCRVANHRQGSLVIETSSSAWKMRINYERQQIISAFRLNGLPGVATIEIVINPGLFQQHNPIKQKAQAFTDKPPITPVAAEYLKATAEMAPPKLKDRLEKIAALAHKNKQLTN